MRSALTLTLATGVLAARPFLNEADTGLDEVLSYLPAGQRPELSALVGLPDFDYAARHALPARNYTYYRSAAGGEASYRNNLEVYNRYRLRPKNMVDVTNVGSTMNTTILGYNFSAPIFVSPCARGDLAHPDAELNLIRGVGEKNVLYIVSSYSSKTLEEIAAAKAEGQVFFSQFYPTANDTENQKLFDRAAAAGAKAMVWAIDAPGNPSRHRANRYGVTSAVVGLNRIDYEVYRKYQNQSSLPIILKGIQSVEAARDAVNNGVKAIILSNHGGRNLNGSPSSLEVALEIHQQDPSIFKEIEVLADGGVRYGTDALRLMALGVKAVGVGRPFMYSLQYGVEGPKKVASILINEIVNDAANLGVADLKKIDPSYVNWTPNNWGS